MKPALSVIFFTVSSGAGFGLIALLALADLLRWGEALSDGEVAAAGVVALVLVSAGLLSSTLHLANPMFITQATGTYGIGNRPA